MEIGEVLNAMLIKITSWFTTIFGYVKDYYKEFIKDPQKFLQDHTIVVILAIFVLILIGVIIFNIIRDIKDKRAIRKEVLAKYLEDEKKSKEEIVIDTKDDFSNEKEFEELLSDISEKEEIIENVPTEFQVIEEKVEAEPIKEEVKEETIKEEIFDTSLKENIDVSIKDEKTNDIAYEEPFYVDARKPIYQNTIKEEPIISDIENEILDIEFEAEETKIEKKEEPVEFDPIPELRVLDKENVDTMEEIISEEPEPIVMEKIEVVRINPVKKYGPENFDTNRQGKTFTYEELAKLIKD